ncbi:MAG: hypothetical protein E4H00_11125 [Myxococcales bacterium]|nr:MAG: hypothetical protein E4H00_11125 [Myxococcales bacterium]
MNETKRLAAFQNPEFYKKQNLRLSTALTPRVIACAEDLPAHIELPRGCLDDLEALLRDHGVALSIQDMRNDGKPLDVTFRGQLTAPQKKAARALLKEDFGIFVAPPCTGKTVVGIHAITQRARNTLILVHRQPLLEQWVTQLAVFLGLETKEIGRIGGGKRNPNGTLDVAMLQSLVRRGKIDDLVASYGHVIVDECHHVPAVSFERVLREVKARFVTGLTATPLRRDGHHPIIEMQLGPIRFEIDSKSKISRPAIEHQLIVRDTSFRHKGDAERPPIQALYRARAADDSRNELIIDDVLRALEEGRSPSLLTERKDHLTFFADRLAKFTRHMVVLHGGMGGETASRGCGTARLYSTDR